MDRHRPTSSAWKRRQILQAGALGGAAMAVGLGPTRSEAAEIPLDYDGRKFQLAAPEPNPKRGGVLRYGITSRPPHFWQLRSLRIAGTVQSPPSCCARAATSSAAECMHARRSHAR